MIIVYAPKDGEREHFDARSLRVSEASIVSRTLSRKWAEVQQGIQTDDIEVMRAMAWVIKKRSQPSMALDDFDPGIEELYTRLDRDEVVSYVQQALAVASLNPDATPEQIRGTLADLPYIALDPEQAERVIEEMVTDPKDETSPTMSESPNGTQTSTSSESSTSDSSLTSSTSHPAESTS